MLLDLHPKYQVDERGQRFVILTEEEFENLLAWAEALSPDPDAGLKLRPKLQTELREQQEQINQGLDNPIPWDQVKREFGLD